RIPVRYRGPTGPREVPPAKIRAPPFRPPVAPALLWTYPPESPAPRLIPASGVPAPFPLLPPARLRGRAPLQVGGPLRPRAPARTRAPARPRAPGPLRAPATPAVPVQAPARA